MLGQLSHSGIVPRDLPAGDRPFNDGLCDVEVREEADEGPERNLVLLEVAGRRDQNGGSLLVVGGEVGVQNYVALIPCRSRWDR